MKCCCVCALRADSDTALKQFWNKINTHENSDCKLNETLGLSTNEKFCYCDFAVSMTKPRKPEDENPRFSRF